MEINQNKSLLRTGNIKQQTLYNMIGKQSVKVAITQNALVDACVDLVTLNGRPFSMMNDSGFRKIIDPIIEALGGHFSISDKNIRNFISERAEII